MATARANIKEFTCVKKKTKVVKYFCKVTLVKVSKVIKVLFEK